MKLLFKNSLKKIRGSLGRFVSLFVIVALGVGFYAGIRSSSPSMLHSMDIFYQDHHFMDLKVQTSLGITNQEIIQLAQIPGVQQVEGSYTHDTLIAGEVVRIHSISETMNTVQLDSGRLPENDAEVLGDATKFTLGQSLSVTDENLTHTEYTVVGLVNSVLYTYLNYGSSDIGSGQVSAYLFAQPSTFSLSAFTEAYIIGTDTRSADVYSAAYEAALQTLSDQVTAQLPALAQTRLTSIKTEALAAYQQSLDDFNQQKQIGQAQFDAAQQTLLDSQKQLDQAKAKLDATAATLQSQRSQLTDGIQQVQAALTAIEANLQGQAVETVLQELNLQRQAVLAQMPGLDQNSSAYQQLAAQLAAIDQQIYTLSTTYPSLQTQLTTLTQQRQAIDIAEATQVNPGYAEIASQQATLNQGTATYQANRSSFEQEIAAGQKKLDEARTAIDDLSLPTTYLFSREDVQGYRAYHDDTNRVSLIANVIPVFFMIVVLTMCLNTMSRMIEEERSEIGTLVSLGFNKTRIAAMYLLYVLVAAVSGLFSGFYAGTFSIPRIIYNVYKSYYKSPALRIEFDYSFLMVIAIIILSLMIFVTLMACRKAFRQKPAELTRPLPPKNGKKIALEKVTWLWKRFSFTWKITIRNMFRYKKRVLMTVFGVAGCTALLLTGFGLQDSIAPIVHRQFGNIFTFDATATLKESAATLPDATRLGLEELGFQSYALYTQSAVNFKNGSKSLNAFIISPQDPTTFESFYHLVSPQGQTLTLQDHTVIISSKMARLLKASINDTITVENQLHESFTLTVGAITENYTGHYIYMNAQTYQSVFGSAPTYDLIALHYPQGVTDTVSDQLLKVDSIGFVNLTSNSLNMFEVMIHGLNGVVLLIIVVACLLALVVLYNLTSINISERLREISTLKVLGFYDGEVSSYIYRESIVLSLLGILVGLVLGIFLHHFVINLVEPDTVVFVQNIKIISYVYSLLLTMSFSIIVQIATYFKLKHIHMLDALKSVE